MPTIPQYSDPQQQVKPEALPNAKMNVDASAEAFNNGPSSRDLQSATLGAEGAVTDVAIQARDRADQVAHMQADTQASQLQTQIQVQVSKMKGQDAFGAPDYADKTWQDGVSKIRSGLQGAKQQTAFDRSVSARYQELNKSIQMHVAQQGEAFDDQTTQSALDQAKTAATVNSGDLDAVQSNADRTKDLVDAWAKRKGIPQDSEIYKQRLMTEQSGLHTDVIKAQIQAGLKDEDGDSVAQQYYEDHKDEMTAGDQLHVQQALENQDVLSQSNRLFSELQGSKSMKFTDGTFNGEAVRKYVEDNAGDMADDKKLKILGQVKAQIKEYNIDRYHQIAQNERQFTNAVVTDRKNNVPLDQALLRVGDAAIDPYDAALKTKFVQDTYAPSHTTKVIAHEQLKEGIQAGTVDLDALNKAYNDGMVDAPDYANLRQLAFKTKADGTDPQTQITNKLIDDLAKQSIGNDKDAVANFKYVLGKKAEGKSPEETLAVAQDELKRVKNPSSWFGFNTDKYKLDAEALKGQQQAVGTIYQDVGYKQAQAMSSGMQASDPYRRNPDPSAAIHSFADQLGVKYEDLKSGKPANNAITSLMRKGKQVTPAAVQMVLKKYKDGVWP